jgi:hypothetical protein
MFFNALLAITLRTYLQWQNKKFERQDAEVAVAMQGDEKTGAVGVENEGYGFRNIL